VPEARGETPWFFVDTSSIEDIQTLADQGILDGVTTNPTLMAKEGGDPSKILKEICRIVQGPVSGEVVATDYEGMLREGRTLAAIDEHIIVKVPFTKAGVKACKTLSSEGSGSTDAGLLGAAGAHCSKVGATSSVRSSGARRHWQRRHARDRRDVEITTTTTTRRVLVASVRRDPRHQAARMGQIS
jgi:TalC/MipB family fructose-6-phosphate aldolase